MRNLVTLGIDVDALVGQRLHRRRRPSARGQKRLAGPSALARPAVVVAFDP
jgi:hypothetical protein